MISQEQMGASIVALIKTLTTKLDVKEIVEAIDAVGKDTDNAGIIRAINKLNNIEGIDKISGSLNSIVEQLKTRSNKIDLSEVTKAILNSKSEISDAITKSRKDVDLSRLVSAIGSLSDKKTTDRIATAIEAMGSGDKMAKAIMDLSCMLSPLPLVKEFQNFIKAQEVKMDILTTSIKELGDKIKREDREYVFSVTRTSDGLIKTLHAKPVIGGA